MHFLNNRISLTKDKLDKRGCSK